MRTMRRLVLPLALGLTFGTATLTTSLKAAAEEPEALLPQDETRPSGEARLDVLLTGAAITGLSYGAALGASYIWSEDSGASDLRIPVAGPWMKLGQTTLCTAEDEANGCQDFLKIAGAVLVTVDGLLQAGGVALMVQSLFLKTDPAPSYATLRSTPVRPRLSFSAAGVEMTPVPFVGTRSDLGMALVGSF